MQYISLQNALLVGSCLASLTLATGCTGNIATTGGNTPTGGFGGRGGDSGSEGPGFIEPPAPSNCDTPSGRVPSLRRLSRVEYGNTIRALFPRIQIPQTDLPADQARNGFENDAEMLRVSPLLVESYESLAFGIAGEVAKDLSQVLQCAPKSGSEEAICGRSFVESFGARAFRRPLAKEDVDAYVGLFEAQRAAIDFNAAVQITLSAFLQAPEFLYREEGASRTNGGILDDYAVASRLSYMLWQTMPDAELFEAAASGLLSTEAGLLQQLQHMLSDRRTRGMLVDFHRQWSEFDRVLKQDKSTELYPAWDAQLQDAIREESDRFVGDIVFDQKGSFEDLMTSRLTWVNAQLAALYGVVAPADGWSQVVLPEKERAGLLTRANFLASHSHRLNKSPILRGITVMSKVFCQTLPDPPADANTSNPADVSEEGRTNRQLFEARTQPALCHNCHQYIDNFGYAFENYDSIGRFETEEKGLRIDPSGSIAGTDVDGEYAGPIDYIRRIASSAEARTCYASQWLQFAAQRPVGESDRCLVDEMADALEGNDGVVGMLARIVMNPQFRSFQ